MGFYSELVPQEFYVFFMVFARLGTIIFLMPTVGEAYVTPRVRLLFALTFALIVVPVVGFTIPPLPPTIVELVVLIFGETLIGFFLGIIMRILVATLSTTGTAIAYVSGFANAMLFNPMIQTQGSLHSVFLSMMASVMILVTDVHHLMLRAIVDSYVLFQPGVIPVLGDMADTVAKTVARSFVMGIQLASPFLLFAVIYNSLLGLMARLMPQFQVFFISLPLQILLGIGLFMSTISAIMLWFMRYYTENLSRYLMIE